MIILKTLVLTCEHLSSQSSSLPTAQRNVSMNAISVALQHAQACIQCLIMFDVIGLDFSTNLANRMCVKNENAICGETGVQGTVHI